MASAEARARWHRHANYCIIQEDYKGASGRDRLPPSSSKSRSEGSPGHVAKSDDFPADTKWWLHQQPIDNPTSFWEPSWETLELEEFAKIKELEAVIGDTSQKKPVAGEVWSEDDHLLMSEKPEKLFSETESQFIRINKPEPWWRTADLSDLASYVSEKSFEHLDNSDLPRPQINASGHWFVPDKGLASLDQVSNLVDSMKRPPTSVSMGEAPCHAGTTTTRCLPYGLDIPLSMTAGEAENMQVSGSELSKAQLLEALQHSQTRAREAEEAAQKAYNEKEHVITHFLKQASHLFAYKQWLHILQLETIRLQHGNSKYQPIFPDFVPWIPIKGKQQKRVQRKAAKTKPNSPRHKRSKSSGSILLGLALAGAGLLLGWTLGWLFK